MLSKNANILVVGGAGYIGTALIRQLISQGFRNITVFDNLSAGSCDNLLDGCKVMEGDITKKSDYARLPKNVDYVFHLAAATSVDESFIKPQFYLENNVLGTIYLLEWMVAQKIKKALYVSSASVYGDVSPEVVMTEELAPFPVNVYGMTKLDGEYLFSMWKKNFGLDYAAVRLFNVFGEGQDCISDYASVIPKFIYAAFLGKDLTIYGTGKQSRDFIHVADVAEAIILVMDKGTGLYNVGSGVQYDINTVAKLILKNIDTKSTIKYLPPVPGDTFKDNSSNKKITALGWKSKKTFETRLKETIDSYGDAFLAGKKAKRK